jgi:glutathione S-transferase
MYMRAAKVPEENQLMKLSAEKGQQAIRMVDDRLKDNEWLAGDIFTAAEVIIVYSLTTARLFMGFSLEPYPNVLRWLTSVGERPAYRRAMEKGDPGFKPLLGAKAPKPLS